MVWSSTVARNILDDDWDEYVNSRNNDEDDDAEHMDPEEEETMQEINTVSYHCGVLGMILKKPCQMRSCPMWTNHAAWLSCKGAYVGVRSAQAADKINCNKNKSKLKDRLSDASDGKLSIRDLAVLGRVSKQKTSSMIKEGGDIFSMISALTNKAGNKETKPTLFVTYTDD